MAGTLSDAMNKALEAAGIELPAPPVKDGVEIPRELEPELVARLSAEPITGALVELTNRAVTSFKRRRPQECVEWPPRHVLFNYVSRCSYVPERPSWAPPMQPDDGRPIENWGFLIVDEEIAMPLGIARSPRHATPLFVLDCLFRET